MKKKTKEGKLTNFALVLSIIALIISIISVFTK